MEELYLIYHHRAGKSRTLFIDPRDVVRRVRELDRQLAAVWKKRNKASELFRIREVLRSAAADLEKRKAITPTG